MKTLKVERVELSLLKLPYIHFFETSLGREEEREFILVKICADGICGYGEVVSDKIPLYSYETTTTAWHILKDFLIPVVLEKSISEPHDFYEEAKKYRGHRMAKAGCELALWDLQGKKMKASMETLWRGKDRNSSGSKRRNPEFFF